MTTYVVGFAFTGEHVILVRKLKPEWQKGQLNGVGGKIEPDDQNGHEAMVREFKEEVGIWSGTEDWEHYMIMHGKDWICHVFALKFLLDRSQLTRSHNDAGEEVVLVPFGKLPEDVLPNLRWLVPMAKYQSNDLEGTVKYTNE